MYRFCIYLSVLHIVWTTHSSPFVLFCIHVRALCVSEGYRSFGDIHFGDVCSGLRFFSDSVFLLLVLFFLLFLFVSLAHCLYRAQVAQLLTHSLPFVLFRIHVRAVCIFEGYRSSADIHFGIVCSGSLRFFSDSVFLLPYVSDMVLFFFYS